MEGNAKDHSGSCACVHIRRSKSVDRMGNVSPWVTQSHREPICSPQGEREVHGGKRETTATGKKMTKLPQKCMLVCLEM